MRAYSGLAVSRFLLHQNGNTAIQKFAFIRSASRFSYGRSVLPDGRLKIADKWLSRHDGNKIPAGQDIARNIASIRSSITPIFGSESPLKMTSTMRILLVDDELPCRTLLRSYLRAFYPEAQIIGEAGSVAEAAEVLARTRPDLLLLDVHLPDGTGFDLLDRFPQPDFRVIFTTGHDEFALKAFRYSAVDYLLKPIDPDLFIEAVRKINIPAPAMHWIEQIAQIHHNTSKATFDRITLKTGDGLLFVHISDILYLEANGNFTFAYLESGEKHLVSTTMKEFEEMLPEPAFFRIHQSHLVNTARVKKFLKEDGGYVLMQNGAKLPIARRRKDDFLRGFAS